MGQALPDAAGWQLEQQSQELSQRQPQQQRAGRQEQQQRFACGLRVFPVITLKRQS